MLKRLSKREPSTKQPRTRSHEVAPNGNTACTTRKASPSRRTTRKVNHVLPLSFPLCRITHTRLVDDPNRGQVPKVSTKAPIGIGERLPAFTNTRALRVSVLPVPSRLFSRTFFCARLPGEACESSFRSLHQSCPSPLLHFLEWGRRLYISLSRLMGELLDWHFEFDIFTFYSSSGVCCAVRFRCLR